MKKAVTTSKAPEAIGPYSQAIASGGFLLSSGQLGIDPETGEFAGNSAAEQAGQALKNLRAVLEETGCTMGNVLKTTVFLKDMGDFAEVNKVYESFFRKPYPARSCVQVAALPKNALVEIELIASLSREEES